jgi:thiamine kinase-like enzyme
MAAAVHETHDVAIPVGDRVFSSAWLNLVLTEAPAWRHGSLRVFDANRIGAEHGMSGQIHRVDIETERGSGPRSLVVKQETAAAVERELLFRRHCGELMRGHIPDLLCGVIDDEAGRGVLVLEDIASAEQGDVLHGCTDDQADAVVRVLARLHGGSGSANDDSDQAALPRWSASPIEHDRWSDRLDRANERFPEILAPRLTLLPDLPERVAGAGSVLLEGPVTWLQVDSHLDNTLFRPDGTVVLLDWCNAAIGPPVVDLTRFLTEGVVDPTRPERVTALLTLYTDELRGLGVEDVSVADLRSGFELALLPLLQGAVGWAGRDDLDVAGRAAVVCESFLRGMCSWVMRDESGSQRGSQVV